MSGHPIRESAFKKYDDIWNEVSNSIEKEFDNEPIYNKKFLKTKIKSYGDKAADFHAKEIPKVVSNYNYLAVILPILFLKKKNTIIRKPF